MGKRLSLKQTLDKQLSPRKGWGRSKHQDKLADKADRERRLEQGLEPDRMRSLEKYYFHTRKTYEESLSRAVKAWAYINQHEGHRVPLAEVPSKLSLYLDERKAAAKRGEITPRTLAKERSQLSKVFLTDLTGYAILRCTAESTKGRGDDAHWNPENHPERELWEIVGARKGEYHWLNKGEQVRYCERFEKVLHEHLPHNKSELYRDMHGRVPNIQPVRDSHGQIGAIIVLHAKHGKSNYIEILPEYRARLTELYDTGKYADSMNPSDHANVHACRRIYAQRFYAHIARPIDTLDEKEIYRTKDGQYRAYDRVAVARVAQSLGHNANDLFDTIHNYLR